MKHLAQKPIKAAEDFEDVRDLVAYLRYALPDVASVSSTSAALLSSAIAELETHAETNDSMIGEHDRPH